MAGGLLEMIGGGFCLCRDWARRVSFRAVGMPGRIWSVCAPSGSTFHHGFGASGALAMLYALALRPKIGRARSRLCGCSAAGAPPPKRWIEALDLQDRKTQPRLAQHRGRRSHAQGAGALHGRMTAAFTTA